MTSATTEWRRYAVCMAVIFVVCPIQTHQELAAGLRRFAVRTDSSDKATRLASLTHGRLATSEDNGNLASAKAGNVSLENLGESLVRLEDTLNNLVQNFMTVKRSVFNLEQLQELLVILLEDILKQTMGTDTVPKTDITLAYGSVNSGGTSMVKDSSGSDSNEDKSPVNEDSVNDKKRVFDPGNGANTRNNRRVGGKGTFAATNENMSVGNKKNYNDATARQGSGNSQASGNGDSAGGSSEEGGSRSNEDFSGYLTTYQRSTQPTVRSVSGSTKSQWSEPIFESSANKPNSRFLDFVQRLTSRLNRPSHGNSSPRHLSFGHLISPPRKTEAAFDRPPAYQPLEVYSSFERYGTTSNQLKLKAPPISIKHRQEAVVSHGGPLTGSEDMASMLLEHPDHNDNADSTGERSTGMINNLVLSQPERQDFSRGPGEDLTTGNFSVPSAHSPKKLPVPNFRKKRNGHINSLAELIVPTNRNSSDNRIKQTDGEFINKNDSLNLKHTASTIDGNIITLSEVSVKQTSDTELKNTSVHDNIGTGMIMDTQKSSLNESNKGNEQKYDALIASLLSDLNLQLLEYNAKLTQNDHFTRDDTINRVASEISKLFWITISNAEGYQLANEEVKLFSVSNTTEGINDIKSTSNISEDFPAPEGNLSSITEKSTDIKTKNLIEETKNSERLSVKKAKKISDNYAISPLGGSVLNLDKAQSPKTIKLDSVSGMMAENSSIFQEITNNSYTEWEWLRPLLESTDFLPIDWKWLTDTLTQLSLKEELADDLKSLEERGRSLYETKSNAGVLWTADNTEIETESNNGNSKNDKIGTESNDGITEKDSETNNGNTEENTESNDGNKEDDSNYKSTSVSQNSDSHEDDVDKKEKEGWKGYTSSQKLETMPEKDENDEVAADASTDSKARYLQKDNKEDDSSNDSKEHVNNGEDYAIEENNDEGIKSSEVKNNKMPFTRQKRQTGTILNKTLLRERKLKPDFQKSNVNIQQTTDNLDLNSNITEVRVAFDKRQNPQNNVSASNSSSNSSQSPLNGNEKNFNNNFGIRNQQLGSHGPSYTDLLEVTPVEEQSAMDLEEILTSLFFTYWQRFYNLYTRPTPPSTPPTTTTTETELEEEEITETTLQTTLHFTTDILTEQNKNLSTSHIELSTLFNTTSISANNSG